MSMLRFALLAAVSFAACLLWIYLAGGPVADFLGVASASRGERALVLVTTYLILPMLLTFALFVAGGLWRSANDAIDKYLVAMASVALPCLALLLALLIVVVVFRAAI